MHKVLIVANQTIGGADLARAINERIAAGPCTFHLLVPVPPAPPSAIAVGLAAVECATTAIMDLPDQREIAGERLACGLEWLRDLGTTAEGEVGSTDAAGSVCDVVDRGDIDEIIVSTLPSRLSRWLHQDLPHKVERRVDIPVSVVTASGAEAITT